MEIRGHRHWLCSRQRKLQKLTMKSSLDEEFAEKRLLFRFCRCDITQFFFRFAEHYSKFQLLDDESPEKLGKNGKAKLTGPAESDWEEQSNPDYDSESSDDLDVYDPTLATRKGVRPGSPASQAKDSDDSCGLCGSSHPEQSCPMTDSSSNLAEYRRLLFLNANDEPFETRVRAFAVSRFS